MLGPFEGFRDRRLCSEVVSIQFFAVSFQFVPVAASEHIPPVSSSSLLYSRSFRGKPRYYSLPGSTIGYEDGIDFTSGKSTQKAFIFMPYKNPAKLSLNRAKLSCMSCKCMKLASRSAIESDSSAKAGSSDSSGEEVV